MTFTYFATAVAWLNGSDMPIPAMYLLIALIAEVVRGVGLLKLFFFHEDSWIYIGGSVIIDILIVVSSFINPNPSFHSTYNLLITGVSWAIWIGIAIYSYKIPAEQSAAANS
jgi:hypothetical protein